MIEKKKYLQTKKFESLISSNINTQISPIKQNISFYLASEGA